jgi:hypothetical protein
VGGRTVKSCLDATQQDALRELRSRLLTELEFVESLTLFGSTARGTAQDGSSGCFARKIEQAIFVTSGRLSAEQRREAGEARVVVIEGREEISRIAKQQGLEDFELFEGARDI